MPKCTFCGKEKAIHEMATSETGEGGTRYYCSSECVREERRIEAFEEGVEELTAAMDRVASAMETAEREMVAEH